MKTRISLFLLFVTLALTAAAQNYDHNLSRAAFDAIRYKGKTIAEITAIGPTNKTGLDAFVGGGSVVKPFPEDEAFEYHWGSNHVAFMSGRMINLEINTAAWPVVVNGVTLKVGDPVSKVALALAPMQLKLRSPDAHVPDLLATLSFTLADEKLWIRINPSTKVIVSMNYYVDP